MADLLRLEYIPLAQAVLWDGNPKKHDIGAISESIQRYGYKDPAKFEPSLNDGKGALVEGNGRTHALQMMRRQKMERPRGVGLVEKTGEWAVPVLFGVDAESETVARAYAIDHNSLVLAGSDMSALDITRMWDDTLYAQVLTELASADELPVSVDRDDLDLILEMLGSNLLGDEQKDALVQIDKAEELRVKYGVELGQAWKLGEHWVVCGDCMDEGVVERVEGETVVDLLLTDPPYGVNWDTDYTRFTTAYGTKRIKHAPIVNDDSPFDPAPWLNYPQVILWGANWYCQHIPMGTWLVWDKWHLGGAAWLSDAELAWQKGKRGVYLYAEVVQGAHRKERAMHPTQKPVGLMEWCINRCENVKVVFDPFLGSGTTLIACENLGRVCRGIEIDPRYVGVCLERFYQMTGIEPKLLKD